MPTNFLTATNYGASTVDVASFILDTFSVTAGHGSRFPTGRQIVRLSNGVANELIICSSRSGDTFTIEGGGRGAGGTIAGEWNVGDHVECVMTADHLVELQAAVQALEKFPVTGWGMAPGVYTVPHRTDTFAGTFLTQNRIYLTPLEVTQEVSISALLVEIIGAGSAGSVARMALYRPTGGLNFALVVESGTSPISAIGPQSAAVSTTLKPALYAAAIVHNSAVDPQFRSASLANGGFYHLFPQATLNGTRHLMYKNQAFGPFPATLSPPYTYQTGMNVPLLGINVV